jgi:hypothetical protein
MLTLDVFRVKLLTKKEDYAMGERHSYEGPYVSSWREDKDANWMMKDRQLRSKMLYSSLTTAGM